MKTLMPFQAAKLILIVIVLGVASHAFSQSPYKVGVPVSDTIDTQFIINNAVPGGCDYPQDNLWFKLAPSLIPHVTGLSFQIVIAETNGRVWSNLSDTVKAGDAFSLLPMPSDSGFKIFLTATSSYRFITKVIGTPAVPNEPYFCEIKHGQTAAMCANSYIYYGEGPICQVQPATSVEGKGEASQLTQFQLLQNYPNPFNPETTIEYTLPQPSIVHIKIFDMLGQEVRTLVNEFQQPGSNSVVWDGRNNHGQLVPSGQYLYRLTADGFTQSSKSLLLR